MSTNDSSMKYWNIEKTSEPYDNEHDSIENDSMHRTNHSAGYCVVEISNLRDQKYVLLLRFVP